MKHSTRDASKECAGFVMETFGRQGKATNAPSSTRFGNAAVVSFLANVFAP